MSRPFYEHTQTNVFMRIGMAVGAAITGSLTLATFVAPAGSPVALPVVPLALVSLALAFACLMSSLTVRVDRKALRVHFGVGFPRRTVPLQEIRDVELTRTRWSDGWGLRLTTRGWLYNIAGRDALLVQRTHGKAVLIGTDDPRRLRSALQAALERSKARARTPSW